MMFSLPCGRKVVPTVMRWHTQETAHELTSHSSGDIKGIHKTLAGSGNRLMKKRNPALSKDGWESQRCIRVASSIPPAPETVLEGKNDEKGIDVQTSGKEIWPGVYEGYWKWNGYSIRYTYSGTTGPPVLCIHGFGGNADHWRKNLPVLGKSCRAFAIDLLGYGFSDKPDPRNHPGGQNSIYNFENWSQQVRDFIKEVIKQPTVLTCNSVGGIAGLQAANDDPQLIPAVQVINISLRMLHLEKQLPWQRPLVAKLQSTLRTTSLGQWFFSRVATRDGVRSVLRQCYSDPAAVTEELIDVILTPGLDPGAVHVFLDFISYSGGPLPEKLIRDCPVPVSILWGDADPWEKVEWGREFSSDKYPAVEEFITLSGVGHCPQDERSDLVNPLIMKFVERHST